MKSFVLYALLVNSIAEGMLISPHDSGFAKVCPEKELVLTCTTNEDGLVWNFWLINDKGMPFHQDWFFSSVDLSNQTQQFVVNHTTITSTRTSAQNVLPLVSTLAITNISNALNMTQINCTEVRASILVEATPSTTAIHIISNTGTSKVKLSQQFEPSTVRVTLDWSNAEEFLYSYHFSTDQQLEQSFAGNTTVTVKLTVLYNTLYNVSVVATHRCSLKNVTSFFELYYTKCRNPANLIDLSVTVIDYIDPALAGSNVSFSCDPGYVLNGPSTATCTNNGEWEPDPRNSTCKMIIMCAPPSPPSNGYIIPYTSTAEGATVTYVLQNLNKIDSGSVCTEVNVTTVCNHEGHWENSPIESDDFCAETTGFTPRNYENIKVMVSFIATTMFAVGAVVFFLIGFLCGYLSQKRKKLPVNASPSASNVPPVYEDVCLPKHNQQELELSKNIAYGPMNTLD